MSAIGSLVFCNDCGNLLESSAGNEKALLTCQVCGAKCKDTSSKTITSTSKASDFPSSLRAKLSDVQNLSADDVQTEATIQQTCPECGSKEMRYTTMQLRSADEGSTVFYRCECGYRYSVNN